MNETNWDEFAQGIVDDVAEFKNKTIKGAARDLKKRLSEQGVPTDKIDISDDNLRVSYNPPNEDDMKSGKIYFDAVYNEVDSDPDWPEGKS